MQNQFMNEKTYMNKTKSILVNTILSLDILFSISSLVSILLYVFVHGIEQGVWEFHYLVNILIAAVISVALIAAYKSSFLHSYELRWKPLFISLVLFCVSFGFQYFILSFIELEPQGDYAVFFYVAEDIASRVSVRLSEYVALFPHILGYSSFLGFLFRLMGRFDIAPLVNALLGALSTVFLFLTIRHETDCTTGVIASIVWILCPSMLIYNSMALSEPLYTNSILLFLLIILSVSFRKPRSETADDRKDGLIRTTASLFQKKNGVFNNIFFCVTGCILGMLLGWIQIVRPLGLILLLSLILSCLLCKSERTVYSMTRQQFVLLILFIVLAYSATGSLWQKHAVHILGEMPAHFPGYNFLTGFNAETSGTHSDEDFLLLYEARHQPGATADSAQREMLALLIQKLQEGSGFLPRLFVEKLKIFTGSDDFVIYYADEALSSSAGILLSHLCNVYFYLLLIFTAFSSYSLLRQHATCSPAALFVSLYILGLSFVHVFLVETSARYHYSIIPLMIILIFTSRPLKAHSSDHSVI